MKKTLLRLIFIPLAFLVLRTGQGGNLNLSGQKTLYFLSKSSNATILNDDGGLYLKSDLKGESVAGVSERELENFLKRVFAKKVLSETGEDFKCDYYYSPLINDFVILSGRKVNIHVSKANETTVVGTPLIFGSF